MHVRDVHVRSALDLEPQRPTGRLSILDRLFAPEVSYLHVLCLMSSNK